MTPPDHNTPGSGVPLTRREMLAVGAALGGWATAARANTSRPGVSRGTGAGVLLAVERALAQSREFAAGWPLSPRLELGADPGDALFGPGAREWANGHDRVLGLTTPRVLFCFEQVAATRGWRSVSRCSSPHAGTPWAAAQQLRGVLNATPDRQPLAPAFDAVPDCWVAWLMAPRSAFPFQP